MRETAKLYQGVCLSICLSVSSKLKDIRDRNQDKTGRCTSNVSSTPSFYLILLSCSIYHLASLCWN